LANDFVTQVKEDKQGNIIIGTNEGFTVLKDGLNSFKSGAIEIYNNKTGYPVKDVNTCQAMLIDSKGIIWAGTGDDKTALVRFDYSAVNKNTKPLTLFIQSVKVNEENICWYNMVQITNGNESAKEQNDTNNSHDSQFRKSAKNLLSVPQEDSLSMLLAQFNAFGKTVSQDVLDEQAKKFGDIKFDGITKWYPLPENLVLPYNHNSVTFDFIAIETGRNFLVRYQYILEGYDNDWSPLTEKTSATFGNIHEGTYIFKLKARSPERTLSGAEVWSEPITYTFRVLPPWFRTWWMYTVYGIMVIVIIVVIVWWNGRRLREYALMLKKKVEEATAEIREQKKVVEQQKELVEVHQKDIIDSINYAKRIQRALFPHRKDILKQFPQSFVLFKPKDIVSGDFYYAAQKDNRFYLAACDCTGHGVPGAFMSLLNISFLNEAINGEKLIHPDEIFNHVRQRLIGSIEGGQDGMDGILVCFEKSKNEIYYAGANNAPILIQGGQIIQLDADKMPIGAGEKKDSFKLHTIELNTQYPLLNTTLYLYTDGYADQFGGPKGKKFKYKPLNEMLLAISDKPLAEQKTILEKTFEDWKGNLEQVDDVLIVGIRI